MLIASKCNLKMPISIKNNKKGTALIYVILVIGLLSVLVTSFIVKTRNYINFAEFARDQSRAYYISKSGVELSAGFLTKYSSNPQLLYRILYKIAPYESGYPLFGGTLKLRISESGSKFNINQLIYEDGSVNQVLYSEIQRLFNILGIPENVMENIVFFMQKNSLNYESLEIRSMGFINLKIMPSSLPILNNQFKNQFISLRDLMLVPSMKYKYYYILRHFLTVYSSGLINVNSAPWQVIEALNPDISRSAANKLVKYRIANPILSNSQIANVPGFSSSILTAIVNQIETTSIYYLIHSTGIYNGAASKISVLFYGSGGKIQKVYEYIK